MKNNLVPPHPSLPLDSHDAHLVIKGLELGQVMKCLGGKGFFII